MQSQSNFLVKQYTSTWTPVFSLQNTLAFILELVISFKFATNQWIDYELISQSGFAFLIGELKQR